MASSFLKGLIVVVVVVVYLIRQYKAQGKMNWGPLGNVVSIIVRIL